MTFCFQENEFIQNENQINQTWCLKHRYTEVVNRKKKTRRKVSQSSSSSISRILSVGSQDTQAKPFRGISKGN